MANWYETESKPPCIKKCKNIDQISAKCGGCKRHFDNKCQGMNPNYQKVDGLFIREMLFNSKTYKKLEKEGKLQALLSFIPEKVKRN